MQNHNHMKGNVLNLKTVDFNSRLGIGLMKDMRCIVMVT